MLWWSRSARYRCGLVAACVLLMLILTACGGDDNGSAQEASPTPVEATATPEPTATATPEPSPTPEPTATPTVYVPAPTVAVPRHIPPQPQPPTAEPVEATPTPVDEPVQDPTPEPVPPEETPSGEGGLGDEIYYSALTDCETTEFDIGSIYASEAGCHIVNNNTEGIIIYTSFDADIYRVDNVLASIDVRMVSENPDSYACLKVRSGPLGWDDGYSLCISGSGGSFAEYLHLGDDEQLVSEFLVAYDFREGTLPANEWNRLTIVAEGANLTFFVNDEVIGSTSHSAIVEGGFAYVMYNYDQHPAEWVFTNLDVWEIQQ